MSLSCLCTLFAPPSRRVNVPISVSLLLVLLPLRLFANVLQPGPTVVLASDPLCGRWVVELQQGEVALRVWEVFAEDGGYACRAERSQPGGVETVRFGGRWRRFGNDALIEIAYSDAPAEVSPGQTVVMRAVETTGDQMSYADQTGARYIERRAPALLTATGP